MKNLHSEIFCFTIENRRFAVPLSSVVQVLMATAVSPVPNSPPVIHGLIDYHGLVLPVINLRFRLNVLPQPILISNIFIIADTPKRTFALLADAADGVIAPNAKDLVSAADIDTGIAAQGIFRRDDGIILIYDMENFLSGEEEIILQEAIDNHMKLTKS